MRRPARTQSRGMLGSAGAEYILLLLMGALIAKVLGSHPSAIRGYVKVAGIPFLVVRTGMTKDPQWDC